MKKLNVTQMENLQGGLLIPDGGCEASIANNVIPCVIGGAIGGGPIGAWMGFCGGMAMGLWGCF